MELRRIQKIDEELAPKRVLIVYGPRRVGKTTLVREYAASNPEKLLYAIGDDFKVQRLLNSLVLKDILEWAEPYKTIIIDEAQYIEKIGQAIKMLVDSYPEKTIILTGSSSFDISQKTGEPLVGRNFTMTLLPIMQSEIAVSQYEKKNSLPEFLVYGSYPEVLLAQTKAEKRRILDELINSYLLKDILVLDNIKSPTILVDILNALAFQIGNEVSFSEIGKLIGRDTKTVQRYIDILQKTFVIKQVKAFSTNPRNEISRSSKFYFYDLGIRNALINQFNELDSRDDAGKLFENFIFMELFKKSRALKKYENFYFWRTKSGIEVDIVVQKDDQITAYECKWSSKKVSFNKFLEMYPNAQTEVISKENYLDLL